MTDDVAEAAYWLCSLGAVAVSFLYFRNLGDITQAVFKVTRSHLLFAVRHEQTLILVSVGLLALGVSLHLFADAGTTLSTGLLVGVVGLLLGFTWTWIHLGLRGQQRGARYFSIPDASRRVRPEDSVLVVPVGDRAFAYPDAQIRRSHLAGLPEGGQAGNVLMTYCALSHLGLAYEAEIEGEPVRLDVIGQYGNNLIMKERQGGRPVQHIYGQCEDRASGMTRRPTFRMSFRGFCQRFPEGEVYMNPIAAFRENPFLCVFDNVMEAIMLWGVVPHHTNESLLFETLDVEDDRLPRKALVWGIAINGESACFTEAWVREQGGRVDTRIGGRGVSLILDDAEESLGAFYSSSGARVADFFPGLYWFVWVNFFPDTLLNETDEMHERTASGNQPVASTGLR